MKTDGNARRSKDQWKLAVPVALMLVALLFSSFPGSVQARAPAKVKVLITFAQSPGRAEEALVRSLGGEIKYTYRLVPGIAATVPEVALKGMRQNPRVVAVELDGQVHLLDTELDNAWGVKRIGAGTVHAQNKGSGIKVGILDTGIDVDHTDLAYDPSCSASFVEAESLDDGHGHGTHVAGIVAALDNDNGVVEPKEGVVGVAPEVTLCIYKIFDSQGNPDNTEWSDIIAALERAVEDGVQVINHSYGDSNDPGLLVKAAYDNSAAAGVLHIAGAGNNGLFWFLGDNCIYPALWDSVVATAATTNTDARDAMSSTCPQLELAAPGTNVFSTMPGDSYGYKSGTSMASPHVAGTAALVWAANPGWSRVQVRQRLVATADDLGDPGHDIFFGHGLVDAAEASATPNDTTPPAPPVGLTATAGDGVVDLDWGDSSEPDLGGYTVYRAESSGKPYGALGASPPGSSDYSDNSVTNGTTYYYVVTASDDSGNESGYSHEASATPNDTTPPAPPVGLTATAGDGVVDLDWGDSSEPDLGGYTVYRAESSGGSYFALSASPPGSSDYCDNSVTNGTTYYYVVTASDDSGNESGHSAEASATPQVQTSVDLTTADHGTTYGTVVGTYVATHAQDGSHQSLTEVHSGGKPSSRHDRLEHIWRFDLTGGNHVFNVYAYFDDAGDGDFGFDFSWSASPEGPWNHLLTVDSAIPGSDAADMGSVAGTVYVRATDSNHDAGHNLNDTLHVDHMYVDGGAPATEPPDPANDPDPADAATGVSTTPTLTWSGGSGADSHDVYFGTSPAPGFQGNQAEASFWPGTLELETTYYWRIDEVNAVGTTTGIVWSFTTRASGPGTIYVSHIAMVAKSAGPNRSATATVTIHDIDENPVAGATVYGTWSGSYSQNVSGVTEADGTVAFTSGKVRDGSATFTFTVDNVVKEGYTYDPALNPYTSATVP
jgi:subtilisin